MNGRAIASVLFVGVIVVAVVSWDWYAQRDLASGLRRSLNQPIRLEVKDAGAYREFMIGLRVHHYRAQPKPDASYVDTYYDTADWALLNHGFSYRFRMVVGVDGQSAYSVQLEQEPRFVSAGHKKIHVVSRVPATMGDGIANGEWQLAIVGGGELAAANRLRGLLSRLEIDPQAVQPRLLGELHRERFEITDKGRNWFELDHERWKYRPVGTWAASFEIQYEDIVVDSKLGKGDAELVRRVRTMYQFATMVSGVQFAERVPHERAIEEMMSTTR